MKKIGWRITSNGKAGADYKEYEKNNYHCEADEAWVDVELPVAK